MGADTSPSKLTAREALFRMLEAVMDPASVFADPQEPQPDPIADGDRSMLWSARRTIASLVLDNARLAEALFEAKGTRP